MEKGLIPFPPKKHSKKDQAPAWSFFVLVDYFACFTRSQLARM